MYIFIVNYPNMRIIQSYHAIITQHSFPKVNEGDFYFCQRRTLVIISEMK